MYHKELLQEFHLRVK